MNPFKEQALEDGRDFIRRHPGASDIEIDAAAPTFNPMRRCFQQAAYQARHEQHCYRWCVGTSSGKGSGGLADSVEQAQERLNEMVKRYENDGHHVDFWRITNFAYEPIVEMQTC
jgi:hypothetical protein